MDQGAERVVAELGRDAVEPVRLLLLRHEVAPRDGELLQVGVARQSDDLHAILQRARNPAHRVGGADEHHLRQVVVEVEVVVAEVEVLLWIEHLEQRSGGVAAEVGRHLVDLVEEKHRVAGARLLERLDDLAWQGSDVRPAVTSDLRLVPHTAQADPHELPVHRARDRLAERGLADARRPHEAEDGTLDLVDELLDREVLEDTLLRLLETVVVLVEDLLRLGDVELVLGVLEPGEREDPVDVVADDCGLGAHRAHHLELLELLPGLEGGLLRHLLVLDLLLELLDLVLELVALAELLLDRLHLLVEVVLLLRLLHLLLHAGADLLLDLQDLDLALHELVELLEPLLR